LPSDSVSELNQPPEPPEKLLQEKRFLASENSLGKYQPYRFNKEQWKKSYWTIPFEPVERE